MGFSWMAFFKKNNKNISVQKCVNITARFLKASHLQMLPDDERIPNFSLDPLTLPNVTQANSVPLCWSTKNTSLCQQRTDVHSQSGTAWPGGPLHLLLCVLQSWCRLFPGPSLQTQMPRMSAASYAGGQCPGGRTVPGTPGPASTGTPPHRCEKHKRTTTGTLVTPGGRVTN